MGVVLFIDTQTLILIIIAFIILIIWGPSKIPQLARSFGQAVREFRRGASESEPEPELVEVARKLGIDPTGKTRDELLTEINKALSQQRASTAAKSGVDPRVLEIAERLGIDTRGKSEEDLIKEINWRLSNK
ncbi:Sec-independent protein translocase subunit TatA/TatB [Vulcanisaeta distributa]|uniref:Sec-independent translocation protein mttA/Hcf106 n=1 Tax=Vulcanisaeta distributa (strain DSM 14429 / JCM 11212 / NBRC 100878 / IC-017) TaxID=572478 RepID=E1QPY7_VULDI|nr:twin-arginine translocase TatA/TatE family subunit [Vulcanisaeta distributa]ADN51547.1 sec-independent translocation protein mttA/Hcf106 [Vulcanisaeta distributa DSM 14429]